MLEPAGVTGLTSGPTVSSVPTESAARERANGSASPDGFGIQPNPINATIPVMSPLSLPTNARSFLPLQRWGPALRLVRLCPWEVFMHTFVEGASKDIHEGGAPGKLVARRRRIFFADEAALDAVAGAIVPVKGEPRVERAAVLIFAVEATRAPGGPVVEAIHVRGSAAV